MLLQQESSFFQHEAVLVWCTLEGSRVKMSTNCSEVKSNNTFNGSARMFNSLPLEKFRSIHTICFTACFFADRLKC